MKSPVAAFWAALLAFAGASAQETTDEFAAAREIVANIETIVTPDGVQDRFIAELGGTRQAVSVRGANRNNPLILYVHGGPAAPEMPIAWAFQRPWEDYFTVAQWDQRASGKSWRLNDPESLKETMTVERYRDDAIELIELLCEKYGKEKVILIGHSWGTVVSLAVAAKRPDLLHAYVGVGPVIDFMENERIGYQWTLEQARADGNEEAVRELEEIAPYPENDRLDADKMTVQRKWSVHFGALSAYRDNARYYYRSARLSPEYEPDDFTAWNEGSAFTIAQLWPLLGGIHFNELRRLETPIFLFLGRHDYTTPSSIAVNWLSRLKAPKKEIVWFEHSAHLMPIEEPGRMLVELVENVRPIAVKAGDGAPR